MSGECYDSCIRIVQQPEPRSLPQSYQARERNRHGRRIQSWHLTDLWSPTRQDPCCSDVCRSSERIYLCQLDSSEDSSSHGRTLRGKEGSSNLPQSIESVTGRI